MKDRQLHWLLTQLTIRLYRIFLSFYELFLSSLFLKHEVQFINHFMQLDGFLQSIDSTTFELFICFLIKHYLSHYSFCFSLKKIKWEWTQNKMPIRHFHLIWITALFAKLYIFKITSIFLLIWLLTLIECIHTKKKWFASGCSIVFFFVGHNVLFTVYFCVYENYVGPLSFDE